MKTHIFKIVSSIVLSLFLFACSNSTNPGSTGTANINLTDAAACGYDHVYVTVDHIEISQDGTTWTSIPVSSSVTQPIDLLNLTNGVLMTLGSAPLDAGTYQHVRLVLTPNTGSGPTYANAVVLSGTSAQIPLSTPSATTSGYKILGSFTVAAGTLSDLVLDFNACKSIVVAGHSGRYNLKPVVTATSEVVSGTISGFALAGSQVSAYSEPDGTLLTGTIVPSTGTTAQFNLGPLVETDSSTSVDVVIVPPASALQSTVVIQGIPVMANTTTWISPSDGSSAFNATVTTSSPINTVDGTITVGSTAGSANVTASQTLSSSTRTYDIAETTSDSTTGQYELTLAALGPWVGAYSTTLPIALQQDTLSGDVGIYSVLAFDDLVTGTAIPVNISAGAVTGIDFILSQ